MKAIPNPTQNKPLSPILYMAMALFFSPLLVLSPLFITDVRAGNPCNETDRDRWQGKHYYQYADLLMQNVCDGGTTEKIVSLLETSVERGYGYAAVKLSEMYATGNRVPKDAKKAEQYEFKAAELGVGRSIVKLAYRYEIGDGVPKDPAKAADLFYVAAEQGDVFAQGKTAWYFLQGVGLPMSDTDARYWGRMAARKGDLRSQFIVGELQYRGFGGRQDFKGALKNLQPLAERGHPDSLSIVGVMHLNGEGVKKDVVQAFTLLGLSAKLGSTQAKNIYTTFAKHKLKAEALAMVEKNVTEQLPHYKKQWYDLEKEMKDQQVYKPK